ncbi:MAG: DUF2760 domain-containing protein [Thermodesulfobacteriota bacterium]
MLMTMINRHVRRSFWWILFFMVVMGGGLYAAVWFPAVDWEIQAAQVPGLSENIASFRIIMAGVFFGAALLIGIVLWFVLRSSIRRAAAHEEAPKKGGKEAAKQADHKAAPAKPAKEVQAETERQALHLLCLLQREGRLLDFFNEDLTPYDDGQIGAAVRAIHENCRKVIQKRLKPVPVLTAAEGEAITIEAGFDPSSIKLTGRVTGEPPFSGVVRHRGWKANRYEMPTLVSQTDPRLLAPAEVEIS